MSGARSDAYQALEAGGARRILNDYSFTSAPQLKRDPLRGRMRSLLLCVAVLVTGCDPARIARFGIVPTGAGPRADSLQMGDALGIAQAFAQRYQMTLFPLFPADDECPIGRYFVPDVVRGKKVGLNFCVRPSKTGIQFRVVEGITSRWGPKGDSLRLALGDTLRARFGNAAVVTE